MSPIVLQAPNFKVEIPLEAILYSKGIQSLIEWNCTVFQAEKFCGDTFARCFPFKEYALYYGQSFRQLLQYPLGEIKSFKIVDLMYNTATFKQHVSNQISLLVLILANYKKGFFINTESVIKLEAIPELSNFVKELYKQAVSLDYGGVYICEQGKDTFPIIPEYSNLAEERAFVQSLINANRQKKAWEFSFTQIETNQKFPEIQDGKYSTKRSPTFLTLGKYLNNPEYTEIINQLYLSSFENVKPYLLY